MNPIDRALGILLMLTGGKLVTATELSRRFEVSLRTIYRDMDRLLSLGIPVDAERGAEGGYRLAKDYIQPPVALTLNETASLLVALALVRGLKATPLSADLDTAERKLLAALPRRARELLIEGGRVVGIEQAPVDIFHSEKQTVERGNMQVAVDRFLEALLAARRVRFRHENPYRGRVRDYEVEPHGVLFDRDRWYLVGRSVDETEARIFRADRVIEIEVAGISFRPPKDFNIADHLGRTWLASAMRRWESDGDIAEIRVTPEQAETLARDWFYRHAAFTRLASGDTLIGIPNPTERELFALIRWLGPGAELLKPLDLREKLARSLEAMAATYRA
ncbi:YafY family transcriptional regulator [Stappia sp. F7233]|uniref:YafY family transcriptional regulator n=1 Tax=Stappia albiluteola TaxID=2758565 RepID=A0A839ABN9_9HYPH|nr:YafY family protein [Stappia albiluteola]MBA5777033.1 YafY family transcriptional regulator [Stappia albiluteola]